jgi:hypothetical protein
MKLGFSPYGKTINLDWEMFYVLLKEDVSVEVYTASSDRMSMTTVT